MISDSAYCSMKSRLVLEKGTQSAFFFGEYGHAVDGESVLENRNRIGSRETF